MTTIDVSHTRMIFSMCSNDHYTISFEHDNHTCVSLTGLPVGCCMRSDIQFISIPNDTYNIKVMHDNINIVENIVGNTMYVTALIVFNNNSFEITFGDDFGIDLVIASSSHGKSLARYFEKCYDNRDKTDVFTHAIFA